MNTSFIPGLSYKYENTGQFRAIMQSLGYSEEYNSGILKFEKGSEIYKISLDSIKEGIINKESDIEQFQTLSKKELAKHYNKELATNNFQDYKEQLIVNHKIDLYKWDNLKVNQKINENQSKDGFTIIDHRNKVCYTGKSFYDFAYHNNYILDGIGTQTSGKNLNLNYQNGLPKKKHNSPLKQDELYIPKKIFGHEFTKDEEIQLKTGAKVVISSKKGNEISIQIDKEQNSVQFHSSKPLGNVLEIGGHKFSELEHAVMSNGGFTPPILLQDVKTGNHFLAELSINENTISYKNLFPLNKEQLIEYKQSINQPQIATTMEKSINTDEINQDLKEFRNMAKLGTPDMEELIAKYKNYPEITEQQIQSLSDKKVNPDVIDQFLRTDYAKNNNITNSIDSVTKENVKPLHLLIAHTHLIEINESLNMEYEVNKEIQHGNPAITGYHNEYGGLGLHAKERDLIQNQERIAKLEIQESKYSSFIEQHSELSLGERKYVEAVITNDTQTKENMITKGFQPDPNSRNLSDKELLQQDINQVQVIIKDMNDLPNLYLNEDAEIAKIIQYESELIKILDKYGNSPDIEKFGHIFNQVDAETLINLGIADKLNSLPYIKENPLNIEKIESPLYATLGEIRAEVIKNDIVELRCYASEIRDDRSYHNPEELLDRIDKEWLQAQEDSKVLNSSLRQYYANSELEKPLSTELETQKGDIVGKISFYDSHGKIGEVMEYRDEKEYLQALKKEFNQNLDGFKEETLTNKPEVRKAVDDLKYGVCGENNPHSLDWYYSKQSVEKPLSTELETRLSVQDEKVLEAIKKEDYKTVLDITKEGYIPSEALKKELSNLDLPVDKKIGIERLLGIDNNKNKSIKIALQETPEEKQGKNNIKDKTLQATNNLFQGM